MSSECGKRIQFAREYRKLSRNELAALCNDKSVTYHQIFQWETGLRTPKHNSVVLLSKALRVHPSYIEDGEHYDDPIERIQPYLIGDASEALRGIISPRALPNKDLKVGYIHEKLYLLSNSDLDKIINNLNEILCK